MIDVSKHWALKTKITIREAAFFICGHDPIDGGYMEQREQAEIGIVAEALVYELQNATNPFIEDDPFKKNELLIECGFPSDFCGDFDWDTRIKQIGAKAWAESKGYTWPVELNVSESIKSFDFSKYPKELRAAIEAFEALKDSKASISPKQRLSEWLEKNKNNYGDLSVKAIDRISTVANWKAEGGTPTAGG